MYYVYILRCSNQSLYTGITTDLQRRFAEHAGKRTGGAKYTASHQPIRFEAVWQAEDRASASRLEYRIKTLTRLQKEHLIEGNPPSKINLDGYRRIALSEDGTAPAEQPNTD